jgi:hypothetical protein
MEISQIQRRLPRYNPVILSRVASFANLFAWFNLVMVIFNLVVRIALIKSQVENNFGIYPFTIGNWWGLENSSAIFEEILYPIVSSTLSLVGSFFLFKSISIGLNVFMEIDFNLKALKEEGQNE